MLLLRELLAELEVLLEDPDDPSMRRLFPPAHADRESEEQYRSLVRDQLVRGRAQVARRRCATRSGNETLDLEEADEWLRALNDLRLVLGTRLDVTEDIDYESTRPRYAARTRPGRVRATSSWLQEQLVEALQPASGR